ncbi:MAG: hypothetical protein J7J87_02165 [Candidatus Diapherotrites archaeon]|nr:hypothetical protein [Candidatus Diapherotrites archaeon]
MDALTLTIALILMMLFIQFDQNWLVFGTAIVVILSTRSLSATSVLLLAIFIMYATKGTTKEFWPLIMMGLIVLALVLSLKERPRQPEYYGPEMGDLGGLMGGGEGF